MDKYHKNIFNKILIKKKLNFDYFMIKKVDAFIELFHNFLS